jgi:hypothetical protein
LFDNYPGHSIFQSEPLKVLALELFPRLLLLELLQPLDRQGWEHRGGAFVFNRVGQHTALGARAKTVLILSGDYHVAGIERE